MMNANDELNAEATVEPDGAMPAVDSRQSLEDQLRRFRRVLDYQARALAKENELESNVASINCGLLRMALRLEEMIDSTMASTPVSLDRMQRIYQAIETHLKVTRQIDRFAQFEQRAADRCKSGSHETITIDAIVGDSSDPTAAQSEDLSS
jgi:hypothetical protein